jgi:cytochrome P450
VDEGTLIATAGSETTAWAITITSYHLVRNPDVLMKLGRELNTIMPNSTDIPTWSALEKLPYLTAVIKEGLRMAGGMLSRFPRVTNEPIIYKGWTIPAGTPVAMTPHLVLLNDDIFPNPRVFRPERWLQNPGLDKYMVAFGKGSRNCIGMHLAYAQLYVALAVVHRRFELELFETDESDATPSRDLFTAGVKLDSKGIRVRIVGREDRST